MAIPHNNHTPSYGRHCLKTIRSADWSNGHVCSSLNQLMMVYEILSAVKVRNAIFSKPHYSTCTCHVFNQLEWYWKANSFRGIEELKLTYAKKCLVKGGHIAQYLINKVYNLQMNAASLTITSSILIQELAFI